MTAHPHRFPRLSRRTLLGGSVATAVLTLLGCGGGDGGLAGVGTGGTGSFSSGPIRGFGSILVGGVHYDESSASIFADGGADAGREALRLGVVVEVDGDDVVTAADGKRRASAESIAVRSEIEGPISAIDVAAGTFTVLGQQVHVTPATVFDDDLRDGLAGLQVAQPVEVYGLLQADGRYTATRVDDEDGADHYKLRGRIRALDVAAHRFQIGDAVVSYADIAASVPALAEGQYVRVELLKTADAGGAWRASRLQVFNSGVTPPQAGSRGVKVEIEGYITRFTSNTDFAVSGIDVDAGQVRWLPAGLAAGVRVEVEGVFANGVLQASEVELEDDDNEFEIEGRITSIDSAAQTLVVRGVTVDYSGARFKDGRTVGDLAAGVQIEVEGRLAGDGRTLVASEIEFDDDDDDEYELEGRIDSVSPTTQTFVLRGITVDYSDARFEGGAATDLRAGVKVEVEGSLSSDGKTLRASEVEFDD